MTSRYARMTGLLVLLLVLAPVAAHGAAGPGASEWSFDATGVRTLQIRLTAGSVRIEPAAGDHVRVISRAAEHAEAWAEPSVQYTSAGGGGMLKIDGDDEVDIVIEIPRAANLVVRMSAGRLDVGAISGSRDIELRAGLALVDAPPADQIGAVNLSVLTGKIEWPQAEVSRGGLFRSFERGGTGSAGLRVKLLAGSLEIR